MKPLICLWLVGGLLSMAAAAELPKPLVCDKEGKVLPKLVTADGFTLTNAQVLAKFADGLLLKVEKCAPPTGRMKEGCKDSVMLIPCESLPGTVVQAVGGFKAAEAEAARKLRVEAAGEDGKQVFDAALVGSYPVVPYVAEFDDLFRKGAGKPQSWDEYQAGLAKEEKGVQDLMEKHAGKPPLENPAKSASAPLVTPAVLAGTEWKWGSGGELELRKDGSARHTLWKKPGSWLKNANGSVSLLSSNMTFTITLKEDGTGDVLGSNGATTRVILKPKRTLKPEDRESKLPVK